MGVNDEIRLIATVVGLNPPVGGHVTVQDAIAAGGGGGVVLGNFTTDVVIADVSTPLTGDGATHVVKCIMAAPPTWLDGAGNIIAAGLYNVVCFIEATHAPAATGKYIGMLGPFNANDWVSCDALGASKQFAVVDVQSLAAGDLPQTTGCSVVMPTDAAEAVLAQVSVIRLAH